MNHSLTVRPSDSPLVSDDSRSTRCLLVALGGPQQQNCHIPRRPQSERGRISDCSCRQVKQHQPTAYYCLADFVFSDTTAATLTCLFFQLALHPEKVVTLQEEIDELFNSTGTVDAASLGKLPYLNAVINETLRMHPPVPSGVQRKTPPQGLTIGSTFIPGNTIVQIPTHTIYRGNY